MPFLSRFNVEFVVVFLVTDILTGVRQHLSVVLICIFLAAGVVEESLTCLLAIWTSPLQTAHLLIGLFCFICIG